MTNEEFKKIPFKYDGDGNPVTEMRKKARFLQVNGRTLAAGVVQSQAIQYISGKGRPSHKF